MSGGIVARNSNVVSSGELVGSTFEESFRLFDRLPSSIRAILHESARSWDPKTAKSVYLEIYAQIGSLKGAIEFFRCHIEQSEAEEIAKFADKYWDEYRVPYPHQAAGVSVQRYGKRAG